MRKCLATRWLSPRRETSFQGEKPVVMSPETPVSGSRSIRGYVWKKKIYDSKGKFRLMKVSVTLLDIQVLKYMYIVLILVWFFCPFLCYIIWFSQNVNTKIRIRGKCNLKPNIYFIFCGNRFINKLADKGFSTLFFIWYLSYIPAYHENCFNVLHLVGLVFCQKI